MSLDTGWKFFWLGLLTPSRFFKLEKLGDKTVCNRPGREVLEQSLQQIRRGNHQARLAAPEIPTRRPHRQSPFLHHISPFEE